MDPTFTVQRACCHPSRPTPTPRRSPHSSPAIGWPKMRTFPDQMARSFGASCASGRNPCWPRSSKRTASEYSDPAACHDSSRAIWSDVPRPPSIHPGSLGLRPFANSRPITPITTAPNATSPNGFDSVPPSSFTYAVYVHFHAPLSPVLVTSMRYRPTPKSK